MYKMVCADAGTCWLHFFSAGCCLCCRSCGWLVQAHKAYLEGTEHRTSSFKTLTQNDAAAAHVIEQRMKKLMKLQVWVVVKEHDQRQQHEVARCLMQVFDAGLVRQLYLCHYTGRYIW